MSNPIGLTRQRLLDRLAGADLALVTAAAGSGKTHLLQQLAAAVPAAAWLRVEPEDVDAQRFSQRLAQLADGAAALALVDDFHLIVGSPAERVFERFAQARRMPLVLAGRVRPTMNLMRAELGAVTVLSADDLRFRSWETEALFAGVYGAPLRPDDAAALTRHTNGWAAGLHLFHLGSLGTPARERSAAIRALCGRSRYLRGYLTAAVVSELPPQMCEFLVRTCVFEKLTAARCDRLLERRDSGALLAELERRQALTTSDDDGRSYRYHEVLRHYLDSALHDELGAAETSRWYARAAAQLESDGAHAEATRLFARAHRWPDVARLLAHCGAQSVADGAWCDGLPRAVVEDDPWLSVGAARREWAAGNLAVAAAHYRRAEELFADTEHRDVAARERRLVDVWLDGRARPELHWLDRMRAALGGRPLHQTAHDTHSAGDEFARGWALLCAGHLTAARAVFAWSAPAEDPAVELAVRTVAAAADAWAGVDVGARFERIASDAEVAGVPLVVRVCRIVSGLGPADGGGGLGDGWGGALACATAAWRALRAGACATDTWDHAAQRFSALGADTARAWALALGAVAAAAEGRDDAGARAAQADALAKLCGVPGAQVLALLATACGPEATRARTRAEALAAEIGMPWPAFLVPRIMRAEPPVPATPATTLRISCLGGFALTRDGTELDWRTLRPRAAMTLRYLALKAGTAVHRDELLAAFWPDLTATAARQNLQVTISSLRRLLEPEAARGKSTLIVRQGDSYEFALPADGSCDLAEFEAALDTAAGARTRGDRAAERAALHVALTVYRGDLLVEDGAAEWVVAERDRLRMRAAAAGCTLAELELRGGDPPAARDILRRALALDPYLDRAWRLLIVACERTGDVAAAERTRREYTEVLAELGVDLDADGVTHPRPTITKPIPAPALPVSAPVASRRRRAESVSC